MSSADIGQIFRAVAPVRVHGGSHVRGIGFQHDGFQRQLRHDFAQPMGLRPGGGASEPQLEAQLQILPRLLQAAGKGMHDSAAPELVALEYGNGCGVGAAYMQQHRQFEFSRQFELRLEQLLLLILRQFRQKIIQADFAHRAQLGVAGQALQPSVQFVQMLLAVLRQIDRVHTQRGIQALVAQRQIPQALPVGLIDPQQHDFPDAARPAACQYLGAVGVEVGEVEMGVGVDQVHGLSIGDLSWLRQLARAAIGRRQLAGDQGFCASHSG